MTVRSLENMVAEVQGPWVRTRTALSRGASLSRGLHAAVAAVRADRCFTCWGGSHGINDDNDCSKITVHGALKGPSPSSILYVLNYISSSKHHRSLRDYLPSLWSRGMHRLINSLCITWLPSSQAHIWSPDFRGPCSPWWFRNAIWKTLVLYLLHSQRLPHLVSK